MRKAKFERFVESVKQAGRILQGEKLPGMKVSYRPLKFIKPSKAESIEIETAVKKTDKEGSWVSAEELIKKDKLR